MKQLYFFFTLFFATTLFAQIPQGFSYQAVALNASGNAVASSPVKIRLSVLDNSATGPAVYTETHNPTTNNMGLFTLTIGQGTPVTGTFSGINWGQNSKFLKVEIDITNGTNYVTIGSSQLLAVPYAMYAGAVVGMGGSTGTVLNQLYLYGSFNSFNAATALPLASSSSNFIGYKYFTAGTQLKFITALNSTTPYGNGGGGTLAANGSNYTINSSGIYRVHVYPNGADTYMAEAVSLGFSVTTYFNSAVDMTYNPGTNTLSATVTVPLGTSAADRKFYFSTNGEQFGDNLTNGTIENGGTMIPLPATGSNFKIDLILSFTGEGSTYTITQL